ncbi:VOC family protein [Noviherbaspirillum sedimenti]|uniref:VOC domain-containing protein n=1 Tax=Noviherbaspirillum sedimenti TaxID=2320865 RepID=A0A3A3G5J9_9BURK|nr:VOC family protein [Noviherbaspirillum sedimenti]RJG03211.1 hypothetical protein D3878_17770 [Noviherbaspirillum sedimenti]
MLINKPVRQFAYVVRDIEEACHHWINVFGAGPFFHVPHLKVAKQLYRGEPSREDSSHALGFCGNINIQLIQQHNDAPSMYRDMYPDGGQGFHHMMFFTDEFEFDRSRMVENGCPVVEEIFEQGKHGGGRIAYVDARDKVGGFIEIYEDNPVIRELFAAWKAEHDRWDRKTDPIRLIG